MVNASRDVYFVSPSQNKMTDTSSITSVVRHCLNGVTLNARLSALCGLWHSTQDKMNCVVVQSITLHPNPTTLSYPMLECGETC
jgi:hypothetical protein